jgi:hypothetical protein
MTVLSKKHENHPGILVFDFVIKRSSEPRQPDAKSTEELKTTDAAKSNEDHVDD